MERLTNSDKEIPTLSDNAEYWLKAYFKLKDYEDLEELIGVSLKDLTKIFNDHIPEDCKNPKKTIVLTDDDVDKWNDYKSVDEQGLLLRLPCKVGDTVYLDSSLLPIEDMECYEDIDNPIPQYFIGRVVSFRFAKRNWVKIAVKAKWLFEWVDEETGPDAEYIDSEKNFSFPLSAIGKTVFLTKAEAEQKLKEMEGSHDEE